MERSPAVKQMTGGPGGALVLAIISDDAWGITARVSGTTRGVSADGDGDGVMV
jgi:hypothetical protein